MWHDLPNTPRTGQYHYHGQYSTYEGHHDYAHYSHAHDHCFQGTVQVPNYDYCQHNVDYCNNQGCNENCSNGWSDTENYGHFETCCPDTAASISPNLPSDTETEKIRLFNEISQECEHLLQKGDCGKCTVRDDHGDEQSIPISDLVDIVLKTAQSIKEEPGDTVVLSKKRQQNKMAAAKYRDRQKTKWQQTQQEKETLERRNRLLKDQVETLQKEVDEMKKKLLGM